MSEEVNSQETNAETNAETNQEESVLVEGTTFKTVEQVVEGYKNLRDAFSKKENAERMLQKMKAPEEYTRVDGVELGEDTEKTLAIKAKEIGLNQDQFNNFVKDYANTEKSKQEALDSQRKEALVGRSDDEISALKDYCTNNLGLHADTFDKLGKADIDAIADKRKTWIETDTNNTSATIPTKITQDDVRVLYRAFKDAKPGKEKNDAFKKYKVAAEACEPAEASV